MVAIHIVNFVHKMSSAYDRFCQPVCRELQINQTAFNIVMFLANNPQRNTARDISKYRWIKPNLVSFTVEKLVNEGYLLRHPVPGDRRKVRLSCTQKAQPIIRMGHQLQEDFARAMTEGLNEDQVRQFEQYMNQIENNITNMLEGEK